MELDLTKMLFNKKGNILFPLISAIAVLALVAAGYFFWQSQQFKGQALDRYTPPTGQNNFSPTQTPDKTAGWEVFTNSKFGYQFKIPPTWQVNRGPGNLTNDELGKTRSIDVYFSTGTSDDPGTNFSVDTNELSSTGEERLCENLQDCIQKITSYFPSEIQKKKMTFINNEAELITFTRTNSSYSQTFSHMFFLEKNNFYHITISSKASSFDKSKIIFDQILSTFKFL